VIWPAGSRFFDNTGELPLLCVGDAGLRYDPVSGDGIVRALRSGVFASYAIADWLRRGDPRGLSQYRLCFGVSLHPTVANCANTTHWNNAGQTGRSGDAAVI